MRLPTAALIVFLGCTSATGPGGEVRRVVGMHYDEAQANPTFEVVVDGREVEVTVITFGNGCFSSAGEDVRLRPEWAVIIPYDFDPGCAQRDLKLIEHRTLLQFPDRGEVTITVRARDSASPSALKTLRRTVRLD